jgi:hypothetical protein
MQKDDCAGRPIGQAREECGGVEGWHLEGEILEAVPLATVMPAKAGIHAHRVEGTGFRLPPE